MSVQPELPAVQAESIAVPFVDDPPSLRDVGRLFLWMLLTFLGLATCLGTLIAVWQVTGHPEYGSIWLKPLAYLITPVVFLFAVRFSRLRFKPLWHSGDLNSHWGWTLILGVGGIPLAFSLVVSYFSLSGMLPGHYLLQLKLHYGEIFSNPWALGMAMVGILLLTPVLEEVVFRGILQPALTARWGPWVAIPITTAVWTALHEWRWQEWIPIFIMGLALGWIAHRRTHLTWCILAHAVANSIAAIAMISSSLRFFQYFR